MTVRFSPLAMGPARRDMRLTTIVVLVVVAMMAVMVGAVGNNAVQLNGYSAVLWCAVICIGTQWLAWIPASIAKTERFYDLTGGLTYLAVVGFSLWAGSRSDAPCLR